jgi:signal transduction histidine kinase
MAPSELHNRDAASAMRILCRRVEQTHDIRCGFSCELNHPLTDPDTAKNLYFIAAEAINNAIRHSQADQINVCLRNHEDIATHGELIIRNNSNQCNLSAFSELTGIGLTGMHFRAEVMKGELNILRYPDDYIAIVCSFQLPTEFTTETGES